ncbi:hypothetical protein WMY93_028338 [Mugilogobius chulae]|uniref:Uncharacterized protein n=1 Tax=Mugilogobius chulae TaxID=88201 RepID=A0AAW0MS60_9GOBI
MCEETPETLTDKNETNELQLSLEENQAEVEEMKQDNYNPRSEVDKLQSSKSEIKERNRIIFANAKQRESEKQKQEADIFKLPSLVSCGRYFAQTVSAEDDGLLLERGKEISKKGLVSSLDDNVAAQRDQVQDSKEMEEQVEVCVEKQEEIEDCTENNSLGEQDGLFMQEEKDRTIAEMSSLNSEEYEQNDYVEECKVEFEESRREACQLREQLKAIMAEVETITKFTTQDKSLPTASD